MIHWDANAGSSLRPKVAQHLAHAFADGAGNPSSVHSLGRAARRRLESARERVAHAMGCLPREVVFTGSGSEAAAIALLGAYAARPDPRRRRIVTSAIEHPCVLGAVRRLEDSGAEVLRLRPDARGLVSADAVRQALSDETALCSLMAVNNETGVVQPAEDVARWAVERGIVFHCDATQSIGRRSSTLRELPAHLLSFSAHKLGGPSGVGVLLNRRGVDVAGLTPGHQENGRRGGTPSVPLVEAMALALELALASQNEDVQRLTRLRDRFEFEVRRRIPGVQVNGCAERVGNTSNLCFAGVDGEALLIGLDLEGICASSGAACASGSLEPSHVLLAMGLSSAQAHASLRFSLGTGSTDEEVDTVVATLERLVERIRAEGRSP